MYDLLSVKSLDALYMDVLKSFPSCHADNLRSWKHLRVFSFPFIKGEIKAAMVQWSGSSNTLRLVK